MTKIRDFMTSNPRAVESASKTSDAARLMRDENVGIVPVVEGERLVGTITDRDIALRVVAEGKAPESTTVGEIATRELVTIDPQQDLDEALRLMARHQVRRLPRRRGRRQDRGHRGPGRHRAACTRRANR